METKREQTTVFELNGKVALVTGAGQNVGAGIARSLARQGATVVVNDFHADRAEKVAAEIIEGGGRAIAVPFDVTDLGAVMAAFAEVAASTGPVGILVNNAGTGGPEGPMQLSSFREMDVDYWRKIIDVNLYGVLNCCKAALDPMVDQGWGRVITVASGAGTVGLDLGVSTYGAAKAGAMGFMRHLAKENARYGITANTIALGLVLRNVKDPELVKRLADPIPVGRLGTPEDVGPLAVYLASEESSWITGQTIGLNGGTTTS
jgi:NAD(P)-dependent dehydrogenase (short-subunit alcohol dehydrogenase family)